MNKRLWKIGILAGMILLFMAQDMDAQRRRTSRSRAQEEESLQDKLWYAFSLGNFSFGSGFFISGKLQGGYKVHDRISVGAHAKFFYNFVNRPSNIGRDVGFFDTGVGPTLRVKITDSFFLQGEYSFMSFDFLDNATNIKFRESYFYPLLGAGYNSSGRGNWSYGLHLLFIADGDVRDVTNDTLEYWIDFAYRF